MTGSVDSEAVKGLSLYALKGAVLVAMSDIATLGSSIPTAAAMEDEARVAPRSLAVRQGRRPVRVGR